MPDPNQGPRFIEGRAVLGALKGWDKVNKDLIREALDADPPCRVRRAKSGHVIVTNQFGSTTTIASSGHGRGSRGIKNYQADIKRILAEHSRKETEAVPDQTVDPEVVVRSIALSVAPPPSLPPDRPVIAVDTDWQPDPSDPEPPPPPWMDGNKEPLACEHCPGRLFANNQSLAVHRGAKHARCLVPGCGHWVKNEKGLGPHKSAAHGTNQFWTHQAAGRKSKVQTNDPAVERAKRKTGGKPVVDLELPEQATVATVGDPAEMLRRVREVLGEDPRVKVLEAELSAAVKRADDAEAQLALIREAMGLR